MKINSVFLCLDLSATDLAVVKYMAALGQLLDTVDRVTLFHNIRFDFLEAAFPQPQDYERLKAAIRSELAKKYLPYFESLNCQTEVVVRDENNTTEAIIASKREAQTDLFVMGKKAEQEGAGSVPLKVLATDKGRTPLLLVPTDVQPAFHILIAAVDLSKQTPRSIGLATTLAHAFDKKLTYLHVYQMPLTYFPYIRKASKEVEQRIEENAKKSFQAFEAEAGRQNTISFQFRLEKGSDVSDTVTEYVHTEGGDALIIGRLSKANLLGYRIGGVARRLIVSDELNVPIFIL